MLCNKLAQLGAQKRLAASALAGFPVNRRRSSGASSRGATTAAAATAETVARTSVEALDAAYLKATSANGLMFEGPLQTEDGYLCESRVEYLYKGPCDSTSSLRLNSATQFLLETGGAAQPVSVHWATVGGHVPAPVNLAGTGLSHLHFKAPGGGGGLACKFVSNILLGVHPANRRDFHASSVASQQGVQWDAQLSGSYYYEYQHLDATCPQGVQGDADSAQGRLWVSRCLGDGLYTDCLVPKAQGQGQGQSGGGGTVHQLFSRMMSDIKSAAEEQAKK